MTDTAVLFRRFATRTLATLLLLSIAGCMKHQYRAEPVDVNTTARHLDTWGVDNPELDQFLRNNGLASSTIDGNVFSPERLYLTGLFYHPQMQVAYRRWQKAAVAAEHSGYRINPEFSLPLEYHSDTSDDETSHWTIGGVLGFVYERAGKREARQARAEVELLNARLAMEEFAVDFHRRFREAYQGYISSHARAGETLAELDVLSSLLEQLQNQFELGSASQFEISSVKLELQQQRFQHRLQLNRQEQYRDQLLTMSQLPPAEYGDITIEYIDPLTFARGLYEHVGDFGTSMAAMQTTLLNRHLALARRLNDYAIAEAQLKLEIEKQYPDIVLSPGFIFDQGDNIWTLGASWILPLFANTRQDLRIRESLQERRIRQQEIIVMQKQLLNQLYRAGNSIQRHARSMEVSDGIVESVDERGGDLQQQIELGGIDRVAILRNRLEYFRARQTQLGIYHEAALAALQLQQLLQDRHQSLDPVAAAAQWITMVNGINNDEPAL